MPFQHDPPGVASVEIGVVLGPGPPLEGAAPLTGGGSQLGGLPGARAETEQDVEVLRLDRLEIRQDRAGGGTGRGATARHRRQAAGGQKRDHEETPAKHSSSRWGRSFLDTTRPRAHTG